jgi:hypothetical protein
MLGPTLLAGYPLWDQALLGDPLRAEASPLLGQGNGFSIRFFGSGTQDGDRVKIPLGDLDANGILLSSRPVNIDGAFTLEFWMKANAAENTASDCTGWYFGNIVIDRDVFGDGDYGDYGIALCAGKLVVGVSVGSDDRMLKGTTVVTDGQWRHVAVTRSSTGQVRLFVDGQPDGVMNGPSGRIDYRLARPTAYPTSDPYLVLGAEKHDYPGSRHYHGLLDDLRLSNVVRYTSTFAPPTAPHPLDANTVALYRFDEGAGTTIGDSAEGRSPGVLRPRAGGPAQHWSTEMPFRGRSPVLLPRVYIPLALRS